MPEPAWINARVVRAVKRLSNSALVHYREHGIVATGKKTTSWVYRRVRRAIAEHELLAGSAQITPQFSTDFDPAILASICPSASNSALLQEMPVGLGSVTAIELLATRSGGGPACFRATFLNEDGDVLSKLEVSEQLKKGYQFLRLQPNDPVVLDGSQRLFLLIEPMEGVAPSFCVTRPGRGELTQSPGVDRRRRHDAERSGIAGRRQSRVPGLRLPRSFLRTRHSPLPPTALPDGGRQGAGAADRLLHSRSSSPRGRRGDSRSSMRLQRLWRPFDPVARPR